MFLHYIKAQLLLCFVLFVIALCFVDIPVKAQERNLIAEKVQNKMDAYSKTHPSSTLFVHFDKTLYTNNDNVWFTAYLLNCENTQQHHTLSVSLINDIDHSIILEEKFVMVGGIGFGNLHLSDSIAPGNYTFMIYTNRLLNNKPEVVFKQPITIKTTSPANFKAVLSLLDTSQNNYSRPRHVLLNVNGNDYLPVANANVTYRMSGNDTLVTEGKAKTDKAGQYTIQVPPGKNMVRLQVGNKKSSQYLYMSMPYGTEKKLVNFYPEGGNLIQNLPAHVAWEVTSSNKQPLRVKGALLENNVAIDTIETDSYGIGSFVMVPQSNKSYTVKLAGPMGFKDTVYKLPNVLPFGLSMSINHSLANDTLNMVIRSTQSGVAYVNIHKERQIYASVPVYVKALLPLRVKIALTTLPKGLAEVTLTDSLGQPYAERIFFAHYNVRDQLIIAADKSIYTKREKVQLKLRLSSDNGDKIEGAVSVACVQESRLELKKRSDIESYLYIKSVLEDYTLRESILGDTNSDKTQLENLLMVKSWRKYSWTNILNLADKDLKADTGSANYSGKVSVNGKPPKKAIGFVVQRDSSATIMETDDFGNFTLSHHQLISQQDKKVTFLADPKKLFGFVIYNPYESLNKALAKEFRAETFEQPVSNLSSDLYRVQGLENAIQLRAVTVKASNNSLLYGATSNACGDYVCMYNILNCSNHYNSSGNKAPIVGQKYKLGTDYVFYRGCNETEGGKSLVSISGIYQTRQFYGSDYSVVNPSQPEYLSTLYWNHLVNVNSEKDTELSFYTGDITGKFKIVVQGISSNGVTYSENSITVKKP